MTAHNIFLLCCHYDVKTSHDNSSQMLPIIVSLIGATALLVGYLIQHSNELIRINKDKRRDAYIQFLENFSETTIAVINDEEIVGTESDKKRFFARNKLLLFANDKVIKAYDEWIEYADIPEHDIDKETELFGKVLLEMRRDILGNTTVSIKDIKNLNPFLRG